MITNLARIVCNLPSWLVNRGPNRLLPQLPISWLTFALGIGIERTWYLVDHLILKTMITPFVASMISAAIILILVGLLHWRGLGLYALGLSLDRLGKEILVGLGFSSLYIGAFAVNNTLVGSPPELGWLVQLMQNFSYSYALDTVRWIGELFVKAFVVGVYEEIIFRGWVLTFLLTRWGVGEKALAVSALFFGLAHVHLGGWAVIVTTLSGYIFGLLYLWRKSLVVAITLHILWNWAVWLGVLGRPS